ncbi:MAG TPA: hypothetical protein VMC42_08410 [Methanoregulaceae archaeon]|nr:hypothetical protein [Methanoregulaceae archaeon]
MRSLGSTKIGRQTSRPGTSYPLVRLPHEYNDLVGHSVALYDILI